MISIFFSVTNDLNYDQRMHRICASLAEAGYEVHLVGRKKKNSLPLLERPFIQHRLNCFFEKGKLFYAEYNLRLFFFLLFSRSHCYSAVDLDTVLANYLASFFRRKPLVLDSHELFCEVPELSNRPSTKRAWQLLEAFIIPKLKYAYTVSNSIAEIYRTKFRTNFEVIRNVPQGTGEVLPRNFTDKKILLYQGALNKARGLEYLIEAMHEIDGELWLAGEGDLSSELRSLVNEKGLRKKVKFQGFVLPADLKEITRKATLGINISENAGLSYYYSLNNKFFDYIHAALPSLTNDFPEYRRLNDQYDVTVLVPDLKKETLVSAVNRIFADAKQYERLSNNCTKAAKELCWEKEALKLIEFYRMVFEEK